MLRHFPVVACAFGAKLNATSKTASERSADTNLLLPIGYHMILQHARHFSA
jgi:hypothetical protein